MVVIAVKDLRPVGHGLFADNESYMSELCDKDAEITAIQGGGTTTLLVCTPFSAGVLVSVSIGASVILTL